MSFSPKELFSRINSNISYPQKYYVVLSFFGGMLLILASAIIYWTLHLSDAENRKLNSLKYQRPLRELLQFVTEHQILSYSYLNGNQAIRNEVLALEATIGESLKKLDTYNRELGRSLRLGEDEPVFKTRDDFQFVQIQKRWDFIKRQMSELTPEKNNQYHAELLTSLRELLFYVSDTTAYFNDPEQTSVSMTDISLIKIPVIIEQLAKLILTAEDVAIHKKVTEQQLSQLSIYSNLIKSNLKLLSIHLATFQGFSPISQSHYDQSYMEIKNKLQAFLTSADRLIDMIDTKVLRVPTAVTLTLHDVLTDGIKTINSAFAYSQSEADLNETVLQAQKQRVYFIGFGIVGLALLIGLIGFILGHVFIREVVRSIENLDGVIRRLTSGDLTARVPILYTDEVGRASISFNFMAENFEKIISQLRKILEATKRLSTGDFSARVDVLSTDEDELRQVAVTFNEMAQSFEEIIGQLQHMGISLTTSATEIASASKQQETIIVEQEATTRQISVTANQISNTAKEFAITVSEISRVADETSTLAASGKESLLHMEEIMSQMVDASASIAAKLGILNEKAGNITSVITTITKVADLTNLLSLNAAIEAEKAGEYGRSFAVIAREIRRLADQTALATLDIEKIVTEIVSAISSSVIGVDDFTQEIRNGGEQVRKVGEQLAIIITQVQELTSRFETVNNGMQSQSAAAEQINEAMAQLSHTAQLTTESIHQFRNTILQLNSAATELRVAMTKIMRDTPEKTGVLSGGDKKEDIMGLISLTSNFAE